MQIKYLNNYRKRNPRPTGNCQESEFIYESLKAIMSEDFFKDSI